MSAPVVPVSQDPIFALNQLGLVPAQVEKWIAKANPAFQRPVLSKLVTQFDKVPSATKAGNQIFNIPIQENDYGFATIDTRTANGAFLDLTYTDRDVESFPAGYFVRAYNGTLAKIIASAPGTNTLEFVSSTAGASAFISADFVIDQGVSTRGVWGNTLNRSNPQTPFSIPTVYQNVIGEFDGGYTITNRDALTQTYLALPNGQMTYMMMKDKQALEKLYQQYYAYMMDDFDMQTTGVNLRPKTWINQIKTQGGFQQPKPATMTIDDFEAAIAAYVAKGGSSNNEILIVPGSTYFGNLGKILQPFVTTAGTNNVVGGMEVKGINIKEYGFQGMVIKVSEPDRFLDNPRMWFTDPSTGFSQRANTAMWISTEKVVDTEQGVTLPFVYDKYFANTADVHTWAVPGGIDRFGNQLQTGNNSTLSCAVNFSLNRTTQIANPAACMYHAS